MTSTAFGKNNVLFTFALLALAILLALPLAAAGPTGNQSTITILLNLTDKNVTCAPSDVNSTVFTGTRSVNNYYKDSSYGATSFSGTVAGPYTLNYSTSTLNCNDYDGWGNLADNFAKANGYNITNYARKVYVMPFAVCGWGGLAYVGGKRSWVASCTNGSTYAHELGHSLGMYHASSITNTGAIYEYGDYSDVMGSLYGTTNLPHREEMGWMPSNKLTTTSQSGTYEIAPLELSPSSTPYQQGVKIPKSGTRDYYYLSYRTPVGWDAGDYAFTYYVANKLSVHSSSAENTFQLGFTDGFTPDGNTFFNASSGIKVTPKNHTADKMVFDLNLSCLQNKASLFISPQMVELGAGTAYNYTLYITNNDSGLCGSSTFNVSYSVPAGWSASLYKSSFSLGPEGQYYNLLTVTPPAGTADGNYPVAVSISGPSAVYQASASAIYSVILDTYAPSAPPNFQVTKSGKGGRMSASLSWAQAYDNVKVTGYRIYRNGTFIASVPPSSRTSTYKDTLVSAGSSYTYYATAVDAAGNESSPGTIVPVTF